MIDAHLTAEKRINDKVLCDLEPVVQGAKIVLNEMICFVSNHFASVPLTNSVTLCSIFYDEGELVRAKSLQHDFCFENLLNCDLPSIITHQKSESKRRLDAKDIIAV